MILVTPHRDGWLRLWSIRQDRSRTLLTDVRAPKLWRVLRQIQSLKRESANG